MIKNKNTLLAGIIVIMIQVVWTPSLWSITESGGLHWLLIRIPVILSMPIGICLFLSSIENKEDAHSAMKSGEFRLAAGLYDKQIKCNPQDANLYSNKALALMFAGQDSDAKDCIDQCLAIDQHNQLTQCIAKILEDVASGKRPRPKSMLDI